MVASVVLGTTATSEGDVVFSDTFNYGTASAFVAEGGWTFWSGTGGSDAGSGFCWGQNIVLEFEHPTALAAGETITMDAVPNRPWAGYFYGMRVVLWDGVDDASRVEVAGGTFDGNLVSQVSYSVTPADITAGLTHVVFRYSHDGNWGETQEVSFAVDAAPAGWTWGSTTGGSWATPANWTPDGPADAADQAALIHLADITGDQTITLDGNYTIGSVIFGDSADADGNWILDPGTGGPLTLSAPTSGPPGVGVSNQTATINAILTGTEGLTKSGPGTLILGSANTYTGGTSVTAGTLRIGDPAAIPSGAGAGNLSLVGTLDLADNSITVNGLTANGTVTNSGTGAVTLTLGGDNADGLTFAGAINDGSGVTSLTKTGAGTLTLTGIHGLSGSVDVEGGRLVMTGGFNRYHSVASIHAGPGSTAELDGANMFVGGHSFALDPTRVLSADGGALFMNTAMESRIGNVNLGNGATWTIDRGLGAWDVLLADTTAGAATVTVANTGGNTDASLLTGLGGLHLQGPQNFDVADVTGDAADDFVVEVPLADPGNSGGAAGGINKLGTGTLRLRSVNEYTGNTTVTEGTLVLEEFASLRFVIGADGVNNKITGPGTANLDGDFDIDLTGADDTNANSWVLVDVASVTYGPGFFLPGFTEVSDVHTYDDGTAVWSFTEATGTLSVASGLDYADWAAVNAGGQSPEEDFDGDGTPNGVEFFMGETGSSFTPRPVLVAGTVTWPKDPEANASYVVETSTSLQDEVVPGDGGWTATTSEVLDNGTSVSFTPSTGESRYFTRLRVTVP